MAQTGTVKFYNTQKGFGFITGADTQEYFVHFSAIQADGFKSLGNGEQVQFDLETDPNTGKTKAVNVTGPGGAPVQGAQKGGKGFGGGFGGKGYGKGGFPQQGYPQQGGFPQQGGYTGVFDGQRW